MESICYSSTDITDIISTTSSPSPPPHTHQPSPTMEDTIVEDIEETGSGHEDDDGDEEDIKDKVQGDVHCRKDGVDSLDREGMDHDHGDVDVEEVSGCNDGSDVDEEEVEGRTDRGCCDRDMVLVCMEDGEEDEESERQGRMAETSDEEGLKMTSNEEVLKKIPDEEDYRQAHDTQSKN